jgi:hypothetical protein
MPRWMMVVILALIGYLALQAACGPAGFPGLGPALGLGPQFDHLAGLILIVLVAAVALDLIKSK